LVNLQGLGLGEFLSAAPQSSRPGILERGSFPEQWRRREIAAGEFHRFYVSTYLERDLRSLQQVGNLRQFERFLRASAPRSSTESHTPAVLGAMPTSRASSAG
jgi:hypothetical protein